MSQLKIKNNNNIKYKLNAFFDDFREHIWWLIPVCISSIRIFFSDD